MKIIYIHQYFTTPERGGGTRSYEFARRFVQAGHQVVMITGTPLSAFPGSSVEGIEIRSTGTAYANEMSFRQRIIQFLKFAFSAGLQSVDDADLVLATSTPMTVAIPGLWYRARLKIPMIFEVRDLWPEAPVQLGAIRNPLLIYALRVFERVIYKRSNHIVALSPGMAAEIQKMNVPAGKISIIPNSADFDIFKRTPIDTSFLKKHGLADRPSICYAGALGVVNEIPLLLEAARVLRARNSTVQIVVAGEGRFRQAVEAEVAANPGGNLVYLGMISKFEVAELYKSCFAGLMLVKPVPIFQTNSSNKFFDLMAAGRPIITDMRGWIGELISKNNIGFLAESNAESVANAIQAAASNNEFEAMSMRGETLARERFNRDVLAQEYLKILEKFDPKTVAA